MDKAFSVSIVSGCVTIMASSEEEAREIVRNKTVEEWLEACYDLWSIDECIDCEEDNELEALISKGETMDRVFYDKEQDRYIWMYYNPDSDSGGQVVINYFYGTLVEKAEDIDDIYGLCDCELSDIDTDNFKPDLKTLVNGAEDSIYCSYDEDTEALLEFLQEHHRKREEVR